MAPTSVKREVKSTTCYMCACRCGINVTLENDVVRFIQGNPKHPINQGVLCAKGASGIMKQYSPARLSKPLKRKAGSERGQSEFEEISWEEALTIMSTRLEKIRQTDPKSFAFFTGRDQMQALTGLFAKQFGTPNYAAHGGFCSVNMAAGLIYTIGGSFWEFGGPDLENSKLFIMLGTAEDHHSNPMKIALAKFKRNGGRFIAINPVRSGYAAIADEWVPIKPATDGALLLAIIHEIIAEDLYDRDFLLQYTNSPDLINCDPASDAWGLFLRSPPTDAKSRVGAENKLWWDRQQQQPVASHSAGADPCLSGAFKLADGTPVKTGFQLLKERVETCTPEWAETITGVDAATICRLAREMGMTAGDKTIELPISWTDVWGKTHDSMTGNPVSFHAMRGLAAHSNGFHSVRALGILMSLLGTIDRPGGFRHKAPFPRPIPPSAKPPNTPEAVQPGAPLEGMPLGFPATPEDLFVDDAGGPLRLDKAFSWEYPLSVHGLMHNVITNAWRGDPYPIDTLMLFMTNMAWNSSMNTANVREMLVDRHADGAYKIPFIIVCDTFQSETIAFADLVLPDTTYLERHDVMSMLDRPISEFEGPVDSVRIPVVAPKGECRPFQDVLIELATRLKLPRFTQQNGDRKFKNYQDFVIHYETEPGSGIGFLAGWRGPKGDQFMRGAPNPKQWEAYAQHDCFYQHHLPESLQYMRNWNHDYLHWAQEHSLIHHPDPINIHIYSELLQKFRLAAMGKRNGRQPPDFLRERVRVNFDPLPFYSATLESQWVDQNRYPLNAITQRPMAMYHSWDSQNAWLRQIHAHNYLFVSPRVGASNHFHDGDWIWVESAHGRVRCMCRFSEAVEPGTVWTWNAIGKAAGSWALSAQANESQKGFLLNHLISEEIPAGQGDYRYSNSDPITGQAAWYDVRVRVYKADDDEAKNTWPQFEQGSAVPGMTPASQKWQSFVKGLISQ